MTWRRPTTKLKERKHSKQLEYMKVQGGMLEFIREWVIMRVRGTTLLSKQTNLGIPQGLRRILSIFQMAINSILGDLGN